MRNRTLPLALLIAASLAPVAGCSDNDDAANNPNQDKNLMAEQAADSSGGDSHPESPIPVNDPNSTGDNATAPTESKPAPPAPDRVKQLAQQIATIRQTDQKRLDQQAQRIDTLEQQVKALTKRLRQLPPPTASHTASSDQQAKADKTPAPDAVSPQSGNTESPRESKSNADPAPNSGNDDESADDDASDAGATSGKSPPASGTVTAHNIVTQCPAHGDPAHQFDVFFKASSDHALKDAASDVKSAGLTDWFVKSIQDRLYVGRYGRCSIAARRRDDVHDRTGLPLHIASVLPRHQHSSTQAATAQDYGHDYGASDRQTTATASQPTRPVVARAPFNIIGVEIRGTHHYLGLAPHGANRLNDVTWLTPGHSYAGWTLKDIRTDAGTALFDAGNRTVAVALPNRG